MQKKKSANEVENESKVQNLTQFQKGFFFFLHFLKGLYESIFLYFLKDYSAKGVLKR